MAEVAGMAAAVAYLRRPHRVHGEEDVLGDRGIWDRVGSRTPRPELYRRTTFRDRLIPVLARLPRDFFEVVTERRRVHFRASTHGRGLSVPRPDFIDDDQVSETVARRRRGSRATDPVLEWLVILRRHALEACSPEAFAGAVIHELSHVHLEHDVGEADLDGEERQRIEDEAVALACRLRFRAETEGYLQAVREMWGESAAVGRLPWWEAHGFR